MEGGDNVPALFHQDRMAVIAGEHLSALADPPDNRRPYEDRLHIARRGAGLELRFGSNARDPAIDLPAIRIPFDTDIDESEALLSRTRDLVRQQDRPWRKCRRSAGACRTLAAAPPDSPRAAA